MFFPGPQPRVDRGLFRFRCLTCGLDIDLDDSTDGECADCSAETPDKKPIVRMTREEKKRRKQLRKSEARIKHAKKCDRSTTSKGEKTSNH